MENKILTSLIAAIGMASLIQSSPSFANEKGNGGDAVVCRDKSGNIISAEIADYYEARVTRGIKTDLGTGSNWLTRVGVATTRLERLDPARANLISTRASTFLSEANFVKGSDFPSIPDTGGIVAPTGCHIEQIAIQKAPEFPEDKRYMVNQDIWNKFDLTSQAGLVLHETIYREALDFHATDSIGSRYLNSLIASPSFESIDLGSYIQRLVAAGFYSYQYNTHQNKVPMVLNLSLGTWNPGSSEGPDPAAPSAWTSDVKYSNNWIFITNPFQTPLSPKFETVVGLTVTASINQEYGSFLIPLHLTQVGDAGFVFRQWAYGQTYLSSSGDSYSTDTGSFTFNSDGIWESEISLQCSENFYGASSLVYGKDNGGPMDQILFANAAKFRCTSSDGSYSLEVFDNSSIVVSAHDDPTVTYLDLSGVKSLRWEIFGKTYLIENTDGTGNCKGSMVVDSGKKELRLDASPNSPCYTLKQL